MFHLRKRLSLVTVENNMLENALIFNLFKFVFNSVCITFNAFVYWPSGDLIFLFITKI